MPLFTTPLNEISVTGSALVTSAIAKSLKVVKLIDERMFPDGAAFPAPPRLSQLPAILCATLVFAGIAILSSVP